MRLTLDLLGHRTEPPIDHPGDDGPPQREGSADALVERADPWMPAIGFSPPPRPERNE